MKEYKFKIRGNEYEVEVKGIEDNIATIDVNGTEYHIEIERKEKVSKTPTLVRRQAVPTQSSKSTRPPSATKGAGSIKAPLPGTILELKTKVGDTVKTGDIILIMEAMKMENEIKSDKSGTIKEIKVNVNDNVLEGDILVVIGE